MSGVKTVKEVLDLARKPVLSVDEKTFMKSIKVLNTDETVNTKMTDALKAVEKTTPSYLVYLKPEGTLEFTAPSAVVTGSEEKSKAKEGEASNTVKTDDKVEEVGLDVKFSAEAMRKMIQVKSLTIDSSKIQKVLETYVKDLPKTAETYKTGDISIFWYSGVEDSISSLLSAGTKILDAIMYMAYKSSKDHNFIFVTKELSPKTVNSGEIAKRMDEGKKALLASFCMVYNQGSLPSKTSDEKNLSKFIKDTLFKGTKELTANKLVGMLSTADPGLFPAGVFLEIDLKFLPTEVASRCKMSVAGNRAIRYATLSMKFEKNTITKPTSTDTDVLVKYTTESEKLTKAQKIRDTLSALASDFEAQKHMNPANPKRTVRKNLTLQLTCAIIFSLSPKGRLDLRKAINDGKIEAFKKDANFYGTVNQINEPEHRVLFDSDADFSELSVDAIKTAWGKSG